MVIEPQIDIMGSWSGSYTHVDNAWLGEEDWLPLDLSIEPGPGGAVAAHLWDGVYPLTYSGDKVQFTFSYHPFGWETMDPIVNLWTGTVRREGGGLTIEGRITDQSGQSLVGEWRVTKVD